MSVSKNIVFLLLVLVVVLLIGTVAIKSSNRFSNFSQNPTPEEKQLQSSASANY